MFLADHVYTRIACFVGINANERIFSADVIIIMLTALLSTYKDLKLLLHPHYL